MQLSDRQLYDAIHDGSLVFACPLPSHPFEPEAQIQPASVDLRLGNRIVRFRPGIKEFSVRDLAKVSDAIEVQYLNEGDEIRIGPQEIVFGQVYEQIAIGDEFSARIEGRSRMARLGVSVHCTGDYINPGFAGAMPLQLVNHNAFAVVLFPFMSICQLIVYKLSSKPLISYAERSALPVNQYYGEASPGASILDRDPALSTTFSSESIVLSRIRALLYNYMNTMAQDTSRIEQGDTHTGNVIVRIQNLLRTEAMRDQYIAKQAGIQGPHSGHNAEIEQVMLSVSSDQEVPLLLELARLRKFLHEHSDGGEHDIEMGAVAEAEQELSKGNAKGFLTALSRAGKWTLDKAREAGVTLLVKYIEKQMGV